MINVIDLRSDTVTRPGKEMLDRMFKAEVGDDVFGDDPTVQLLEEKMAGMFGKEAALFCPSGTMTNQVAVKAHTQPGEEIICDITSHVYNYEGGGIAFNSGCSVRLVHGDRGRMKPDQIYDNINPDNVHYPKTRLVIAENTSNKGGGSIYDINDLLQIGKICRENDLLFHLDGARLFNALVETGEKTEDYGKIFDSISVCFSKGLGAPVGSILTGSKDFIYKARRIRKVLGGGMRQVGYLAAAADYAVENNILRLKDDHRRAKDLGSFLSAMNFIEEVMPVQTNIIIFSLNEKYSQDEFLRLLNEKGLWAVGFGPQKIRMVTHLDYTDKMLSRTIDILKGLS
ncbi:MAG: aminotransferase class I/II-fold pyridoxal phosphate-dependent enzyme [Bacteroidales bacterium]|nr:aminotransferase class I/II-fold pyridoxal phosphate-dependent enzyme [Bacteroidales bacterium]